MSMPIAHAMRTTLVLLGLVSMVAGHASAQTGTITGTVTAAATGTPLSGVTVRVYNESGGSVTGVTTDASGVYITSALVAGSYRVRTFDSLGYIDEAYDNVPCVGCSSTTGTLIAVTAGATTSGINFGLSAGGRITGTVTDAATGAPLSGVGVDVYTEGGSYVTYGYTDASGVYLPYAGLSTGNYRVRTFNSLAYLNEAYDNVPCNNCSATIGTLIAVTAGATTSGINFGLAAGGRITGTVTDATTGAPLSGVSVSVYDASGSFVTSVNTNASGVYLTGQGLSTGSYRVRTSTSLGYINEAYQQHPLLQLQFDDRDAGGGDGRGDHVRDQLRTGGGRSDLRHGDRRDHGGAPERRDRPRLYGDRCVARQRDHRRVGCVPHDARAFHGQLSGADVQRPGVHRRGVQQRSL